MDEDSQASRRFKLPLTALRSFEAAARHLSFKDAADELNVSATTISNQIRQIEREWRCQLFIRKTRHVLLTDAGRSLAQVVGRAFEDIRGEIAAHLPSPRQRVVLAVGPIFAARWLTPRLGRFHRKHPKIELVLVHGPRITGIEGMNTPIAVDWGKGGWSGLESRHILDVVYRPVASPAFLKTHGPLRKPADMLRLPIIHQHDRSEWIAWMRLAGVAEPRFRQDTIILDTNVVMQAALDGQGFALGNFPLIQPEIEAGRLVCPFDLELKPQRSYYLLTRPGARERPELRAICEWIEAEASALP